MLHSAWGSLLAGATALRIDRSHGAQEAGLRARCLRTGAAQGEGGAHSAGGQRQPQACAGRCGDPGAQEDGAIGASCCGRAPFPFPSALPCPCRRLWSTLGTSWTTPGPMPRSPWAWCRECAAAGAVSRRRSLENLACSIARPACSSHCGNRHQTCAACRATSTPPRWPRRCVRARLRAALNRCLLLSPLVLAACPACSCAIAVVAYFYPKRNPDSFWLVLACVVLYTVLSSLMTGAQLTRGLAAPLTCCPVAAMHRMRCADAAGRWLHDRGACCARCRIAPGNHWWPPAVIASVCEKDAILLTKAAPGGPPALAVSSKLPRFEETYTLKIAPRCVSSHGCRRRARGPYSRPHVCRHWRQGSVQLWCCPPAWVKLQVLNPCRAPSSSLQERASGGGRGRRRRRGVSEQRRGRVLPRGRPPGGGRGAGGRAGAVAVVSGRWEEDKLRACSVPHIE